MKNQQLILIIEDEQAICSFISAILTSNHYSVIKTGRGSDALSLTASHVPDLILLDLGLPDIDGIQVLKTIRQWSDVPIIVVSARGHEREKVEALDLGADDYLTKPFGTSELLARIRTALRHCHKNALPEAGFTSVGDLFIDHDKRIVTLNGQEIHFTPNEYKIVSLLSRNLGKVLTHDFIVKEIWGPFLNENKTLRVNIANIRRKIEANPADPSYILTEVGVGYRMAEDITYI